MKTYGDSSRFLNECNNMFAKVNGGTMAGVLQNQYHKDFMVQKTLRDTRLQKLVQRRLKKDPQRNTRAAKLREDATKRKLVVLDSNAKLTRLRSPLIAQPAGSVPMSSSIVKK